MELKIRHCQREDIEAIQKLYEQPSCYASTTELPYSTLEKWIKQYEERPDSFYSLIAEAEGAIVGEIAMQCYTTPRRKHVATLGMAVSEKHQGNGIGSKLLCSMVELADNWLNITRIELEVFTDNHSAIALYEKFGFTLEGTAKNFAFRNGHYIDAYLMAKVKT
jgi:L-phenylalanine/L-methionine N-acetyltransferase